MYTPYSPAPGPKIRTFIVDDHSLAREKVRKLLRRDPQFEVIGECADGKTAIEAIRKRTPDLVLLDIPLPGADAFEVLRRVGVDAIPAVIFVTASDHYALKAFEYHAVDYILKPVAAERFMEALKRVRTQIFLDGHAARKRPDSSPSDNPPEVPKFAERFTIRSGNRVVIVQAGEIDWIEAAGNYAKLHVGVTTHLIRETMNTIESRLDPDQFVRVHRSNIVAIDRVKELQPLLHGDSVLTLKTGARLTVSRHFRHRVALT